MKKITAIGLLTILLIVGPVERSHAFWFLVTAAIKKAMKAVDLQLQRQQNKTIWLQNAQKTLENAMSKARLDDITDWSKKQKDQYQKYFDELHKVKSLIGYYYRIKEITDKQTRIMREYERAWNLAKNDKHFLAGEIEHMGRVYGGILKETIKNVDDLSLVIVSFSTEMSDAKRLDMINALGEKVDENYLDLIEYRRSNGLESLKRAKDIQDGSTIREMYGLPSLKI